MKIWLKILPLINDCVVASAGKTKTRNLSILRKFSWNYRRQVSPELRVESNVDVSGVTGLDVDIKLDSIVFVVGAFVCVVKAVVVVDVFKRPEIIVYWNI